MRTVVCCLLTIVLASPAFAQSDPTVPTPPPADAGKKAFDEGRFEDAAREFLAQYELTKQPALLFNVAFAYERAGKCDEAVAYYKRYLEEGKPEAKDVEKATERIAACSQADAQKPPAPEAAATPAPEPAAPETPRDQPSKSKDAAWLLVGGSLAFVTAGAVLAYSASSAEKDLQDLYVSNNGSPPRFDDETRERYDELIAEGRRYQYLSWGAFGIAGGCAIGAAILFWRDSNMTVAPVVTPRETGVSATLRF